MKNKLFYMLIILFICCGENDDNDFANSFQFSGKNHTLDIVSWNIENFPKHELTINEIHPIIDSLNIDIIALQEIEDTQDFNLLINSLGNNWIGYKSQNSSSGVLAYLIDTTHINIVSSPYTILNNSSYYFASKPPYVLEFSFNNINYILIDVHYKSDYDGDWSDRRETANYLLYEYINEYYSSKKLIVMGDFNDLLVDNNNVFDVFLDDTLNYYFTDIEIAQNNNSSYWSFPAYPSHIDHILITNELFAQEDTTITLLLDRWFFNNSSDYFFYVSDHRPIAISLNINP